MNAQLNRAIALLFPAQGRRVLDVKFLYQSGVTMDQLAEQLIVCVAAIDDSSRDIINVDSGLTTAPC
jgi:hypothetical protein